MTAPFPADPETVRVRLRNSVAEYPASARARVTSLAIAMARLRATDGADGAALAAAMSSAHKLAGSAGSMGFPALGQGAAVLEVLLKARLDRESPNENARGPDPGPSRACDAAPFLDQADLLLDRLRAQVDVLSVDASTLLTAAPESVDADPGVAAPSERRAIVLGAADSHAWPGLMERLMAHGWSVRALPDGGAIEAAAADARVPVPTLILVDLDTLPAAPAVVSRLTGPRGAWRGVPWLLAARRPSAQVRAEVAAVGAAGVLTAPVSAERMLDRHATLRAAAREDMPRVLILDADPALATMTRYVLDGAGLLAEMADTPDALWEEVAAPRGPGGVDVVVLTERPAPSGAPAVRDLAGAMRRDPVFEGSRLVLVLSAPPMDAVLGDLADRADVLLTGPLDPIPFAATVRAQAKRARERRGRGLLEGAGPVLTAVALADALAGLMARARRLGMPLTVAWMAEGGVEGAAGADAGHPEGDLVRLLRETLRPSDRLGRGPADGLAVILPFTPLDEGRAHLDPVRDRLAALAPGARLVMGLTTLEEADRDAEADVSGEALLARARAAADGAGE